MVSMYSMGGMGMMGSMGGSNVYDGLRAKYSCGFRDSGRGQYLYDDAFRVIPRAPQKQVQGNILVRLFRALF